MVGPSGTAPPPRGAGALARTAPLLRFVATRVVLGLFTLLAVSLLIFVGTEILPGDVAEAVLGQSATPETVANLRHALALDLPAHIRYLHWLGTLLQGDLGLSLTTRRPVIDMIGMRLGNTLFLAGSAAIVAVPLAVILGLVAARFRDGWTDRIISISTLTSISMPEFFVGYVLIYLLAVRLHWLPSFAMISPAWRSGRSFTTSSCRQPPSSWWWSPI